MIVECFDRGNLQPLFSSNYTAISLAEDNNYLLVPTEQLPALRAKDIATNRPAFAT